MPRLSVAPGATYGRFIVLERRENDKHGQARWLCRCACGTEKTVTGASLRSGNTGSCGCARRTHGQGHKRTPLYHTWDAMIQRCLNPNNPGYAYYGGRGIRVCEAWLTFANFLSYATSKLGPRPNGFSLDRWPDINGHYEPGNVRWASSAEQSQNQRMKNTNTSGVKGVYFNKARQKWHASITVKNRVVHIGYFDDIIEAAKAYDTAATLYHKTSAVTNRDLGVY